MKPRPALFLLGLRAFARLVFPRGSSGPAGRPLFLARHSQDRENIIHAVVRDQVCPLRSQPDKVGAVLPTVPTNTPVEAKKVRVRAVGALAKRDADLRHRYPALRADREEVLADLVVVTAGEGRVVLQEAVDAASHEEVTGTLGVHLNLFEALVDPVDAITAIDHLPISLACAAPPNPA